MPAKSRKQQKFIFARFGEKFARKHHFNRLRRKKKNT